MYAPRSKLFSQAEEITAVVLTSHLTGPEGKNPVEQAAKVRFPAAK